MTPLEIPRLTANRPRVPSFGESDADQREPSAGFPLGKRVMIVEDNWLIANEWETSLEAAGYEVVGVAVSADEALEIGRQESPDFVLMDIRLLGPRDGIDAAIELRTHHGIASVFLSAHADVAMRDRAAAAKPLGWISKPVVASQLPDLLARLSRPLI